MRMGDVRRDGSVESVHTATVTARPAQSKNRISSERTGTLLPAGQIGGGHGVARVAE